jgi:hypothetical protein
LAVRLLSLAGKAQARVPGKGFAIGLAVVGIVGQLAMLVFLPAEGAAGFLLSVTLAAALAAEGRRMGQTLAPQESRTPLADLDGDYQPKETYLVAASRPSEILEQAARDALNGRAGLEVLFVQVLGLPQMGSSCLHVPEEDPAAVEVFTRAQATATRLGVPLKLVYLTGTSAADRILAAARDCRCSRLYLQLSRRTALQRFFKGDVIGPVAEGIAPEVELVIRA